MPPSKKVAVEAVSEYEQLRLENMSRNQAFLDSLGLDDVKPNVAAKRSHGGKRKGRGRRGESSDDDDFESDEEDESDEDDDEKTRTSKRARREKRAARAEKRFNKKSSSNPRRPIQEPSRRSFRAAAAAAGTVAPAEELYQLDDTNDTRGVRQSIPLPSFSIDIQVDDEDLGRKKVSAQSLRQRITNSNTKHTELITDEAIVHCAYRISSMSNKALATRVKMIARAQGKNSREKLLVFYYGLAAAGLKELASSCWDACKHNRAIEADEEEKEGKEGDEDE